MHAVVTGPDLSRADKSEEGIELHPWGMLGFVTGHDFSRAAEAEEMTWALAPVNAHTPKHSLPLDGSDTAWV
jgi:hypothetical protein